MAHHQYQLTSMATIKLEETLGSKTRARVIARIAHVRDNENIDLVIGATDHTSNEREILFKRTMYSEEISRDTESVNWHLRTKTADYFDIRTEYNMYKNQSESLYDNRYAKDNTLKRFNEVCDRLTKSPFTLNHLDVYLYANAVVFGIAKYAIGKYRYVNDFNFKVYRNRASENIDVQTAIDEYGENDTLTRNMLINDIKSELEKLWSV